ncbi:unnamed protein product [Gadus morhua 'NCC']
MDLLNHVKLHEEPMIFQKVRGAVLDPEPRPTQHSLPQITGGVYQCPAPFKVWVDNEEQRAQMDSRNRAQRILIGIQITLGAGVTSAPDDEA